MPITIFINLWPLWFLPLTWQWPARKLSLLWPLCTYLPRSWLRPSAEDVSAFSRRCVGLPPHVKKPLVPRVNKYLCNNIIIVSTKLHPVNRVKNKVEVDNSHYRLFAASNCTALQWMILNFGWWISDCELMWILYRIIPVFNTKWDVKAFLFPLFIKPATQSGNWTSCRAVLVWNHAYDSF